MHVPVFILLKMRLNSIYACTNKKRVNNEVCMNRERQRHTNEKYACTHTHTRIPTRARARMNMYAQTHEYAYPLVLITKASSSFRA